MSETDSIAQDLSKINTMVQALCDIVEPGLDKTAKAIESLPIKYNNFVTAWNKNKQIYDNLTARLLLYFLRRRKNRS